MFDWIINEIHNNDFLVGVLGAAVLTYFGIILRNTPMQIYRWVKSKFGFILEVNSETGLFTPILSYFAGFDIFESRKRYRVYRQDCILPAEGRYFKWMFNRPCLIRLTSEKKENTHREYQLSFYCFAATRKIREKILEEIKEEIKSDSEKRKFKTYTDHYWFGKNPPLYSIEKIFLNDNQIEILKRDLDLFVFHKKLYERCCVPYRRGYLFYGPPGTGKTSTALAISEYLNRDLYYISLSSFLTDNSFLEAWSEISEGSIILFEDIDAQRGDVEKRDGKKEGKDGIGVSLSCLLNCLDGANALNDVIIVFTTNKKDALDPALIRTGRIDKKIHMDHLDRETATKMVEYLLDSSEYTDTVIGDEEKFNPAELQEKCLNILKENGPQENTKIEQELHGSRKTRALERSSKKHLHRGGIPFKSVFRDR